MGQSLFRPEVMEARRKGWLGSITLAQPVGLWVLAACIAVAAVAVGSFLAMGEYTRRSHVTGQLVPDLGLATVVAPTSGIVDRIFPPEGERVIAGARLALVAAPRATQNGADARSTIAEGIERRRASLQKGARSQVALLDAREEGLRGQLAALRSESRRLGAQIDTRAHQVELARNTLGRYRTLRQGQYLSDVEVARQEQAFLELESGHKGLLRQLAVLQRERARIEQALGEIPAQRTAQQASVAQELALLDQERVRNDTNGRLLVKAPLSGLVASRLIEPGQAVQAGQPLLSLLPAGSRLQAQLFVPSRAVGFIKPGDTVLLRYEAFPYQKFGHHQGTVVQISRSPIPASANDVAEPVYRVKVQLEEQSIMAFGKAQPLMPGMMLEADVMGEKRTLIEWLLEPLFSIDGTVFG